MLSVTLRVSIKPFSANAASEFTHSLYLSNTFCTFKDTAAQLTLVVFLLGRRYLYPL